MEFFLLWNFLAVGGVGQVACQGFLVGRAFSVFCWVVLDLVGGAETSSELGFSVGMEAFDELLSINIPWS